MAVENHLSVNYQISLGFLVLNGIHLSVILPKDIINLHYRKMENTGLETEDYDFQKKEKDMTQYLVSSFISILIHFS